MVQQAKISTPEGQQPTLAAMHAKVLIVDSQPSNRLHVKGLLRKLGVANAITEVDNIKTMRQKIAHEKFDCIFVANNLPDGTGLAANMLIRTNRTNQNASTIMIAECNQPDTTIQAFGSGFGAFITIEAMSLETLLQAIESAYSKAKQFGGVARHEDFRNAASEPTDNRSSGYVQDIKPIVGQMMREIREMQILHDMDQLPHPNALERIETIGVTLRRLWVFLDFLDHEGKPKESARPTIPPARGLRPSLTASINARVPSKLPASKNAKPPQTKSVKPPVIFRRRPD